MMDLPHVPTTQITDRQLPDWISQVLRAGWVARGITYAGSGLLAASLVVNAFGRTEEPTQKGALKLIADAPLGSVLLIILALGLILFPAWELVTVATATRDDLLGYIDHIGKLIGVGFYGLLGWSAIQLGLGLGSSDSGSFINTASREALSYPLGRVAVAGAGVVVAIIGIRRARRTWTADFADSLRTEEMSEEHKHLTETLGRMGEAGRGLSFLLIGFFLALAGWQDQGSEAQGLDQLLYSFTGTIGGKITVAAIGAGFFAYGLFCMTSATARRLPGEISHATS